jgi:hypothetical protein
MMTRDLSSKTIVTLNVFQGPSCSKFGARTDKWILKQVQRGGVMK